MEKWKIKNYVNALGLYSETLINEIIKKLEKLSINSIDEIKFENWFEHNRKRITSTFNPGTYFLKAVTKELANGTFKKAKQVEDTPLVIDDEMKEMIRIARTPWLDVEDD